MKGDGGSGVAPSTVGKKVSEATSAFERVLEKHTGLDQTGKEYFNPDNAFDAEGLTRLTEQIAMQIKIKLIENLDKIIRESVKPIENIDGIKILHVEGLANGLGGGNGGDS